jgi:hypothetical protein
VSHQEGKALLLCSEGRVFARMVCATASEGLVPELPERTALPLCRLACTERGTAQSHLQAGRVRPCVLWPANLLASA